MKIATWNVNSLKARRPHVLRWLAEQQPEILALQETKTIDEQFPADALAGAGYQAVYAGQKSYNGVALLSRDPAADVVTELPSMGDPQRRLLGATVAGVRVLNVYVPNGSEVGSDKYAYKLDWLAQLTRFVATELAAHERLVVLGDFNIAPEDRDVHDPDAWRGKVLCSEPERAALGSLLQLGLADAFRLFEQAEGAYSWWDYRAAAFRRNLGLRIDLILLSPSLAGRCQSAQIDRNPRTWERPSDHVPVLVELTA